MNLSLSRRSLLLLLLTISFLSGPASKCFGQLRVYSHSIFDTANYVYDSQSNTWTQQNNPFDLAASQRTTDAFGNMFAYNESTRRINRYITNTNTWVDVSHLPTLGRFNSTGYNLEVTNSGRFLWSEYSGSLIYSTDGSTGWTGTSLNGFRSSMAGDYDPVTDQYAVSLNNRRQFVNFPDPSNLNNKQFSSYAGSSGELQRLGSFVNGHYVQGGSATVRWDRSNIVANPTFTGSPLGAYASGDIDPNTGTLYITRVGGGSFGTFDPLTNQYSPLASTGSMNRSSTTVVNDDVLISGSTFNTSQTAVSRYDRTLNSLTVGDSSGSGSARVDFNSTLTVDGQTNVNSNGSLTVASGSSLVTGDLNTSGTLQVDGNVDFTNLNVNAGTANIRAVAVGKSRPGSANVASGATLNTDILFIGSPAAQGTVNVEGTTNVAQVASVGAGSIGSNGTLNVLNGGTLDSANVDIGHVLGTTGAVHVSGTGSTWQNSGTIDVGNDRPELGGSGSLSITDGGQVFTDTLKIWDTGTLNIDGGILDVANLELLADSSTFNMTGGTISIDSLMGSFTQDGGTLAPGDSPGLFNISGDYDMTAGILELELSGLGRGTEYDALDIGGSASLNGIIDVNFINGFSGSLGDSFFVVDAGGGVTGTPTFDFADAALSSGLSWDTSQFNMSGILLVVPEPNSIFVLALASTIACRLRRRR